MEFIRSSLLKDYTMATETKKIDLPTNPLSHLIISFDGAGITNEVTLAEFLAFITKISVSHLGTSIFALTSPDIVGLNAYLYRAMPVLTQNDAADNTMRCLSLVIPFGRGIFNPLECFPATKKGELTLSLDTIVPTTSMDSAQINVEAVELIGAAPTQYLKSTMLTVAAPGATGENDVDLPIGNKIACIQIRMTTFPATDSHVYGVETAKVLVDNKESGYSIARAQCLTGDMIFRLNTLPRDIAAFGDVLPANIVWVDYDPLTNDAFLLETEGKSSVKIRLDMGVNEATYLSVFELQAV